MASFLTKLGRGIGSVATDVFEGVTGKTGAEAAIRAGELQAGAIGESAALQAEAGREAAGISAAASDRSINLLMEQLGITREQFDPFLQAGVGALPELQRGFQAPRGTTAGGLEESLAEIMGGGAFGELVEERQRGIQGQLAAGGLTRSGTAIEEAARVPTDLALQLENLLFGRASGAETERIRGLESLVSGGRSAAAQEGGQTGNLTQSIIQAITGGAQAQAQALTGIAGATGAGITGGAGATASGILGGAQSQAQGIQNLLNLGGGLGSALIMSSDPRLKENVRHIGKVGELDLVEWDWIPELGSDFFKDAPRMGFMSTQVREFYPEFVHELGGYDAIDYTGLRDKLTEEGAAWH